MNIFKEAGPGRKQCPKCTDVFVPARSRFCVCGHSFSGDETRKPVENTVTLRPVVDKSVKPVTDVLRTVHFGFTSISTPAGVCPVELRGTSAESVRNWVADVIAEGEKHRKTYQASALRYWVRQFYPIGSQEHEQVCELLEA